MNLGHYVISVVRYLSALRDFGANSATRNSGVKIEGFPPNVNFSGA